MLAKEIPVHTLKWKLRQIVILLAVCTIVVVPSGADDPRQALWIARHF